MGEKINLKVSITDLKEEMMLQMKYLGILCSTMAFLISYGFMLRGRKISDPGRILFVGIAVSIMSLVLVGAAPFFTGPSLAAEGLSQSSGLGFLGASISTGLACLGAGIAVAVVGAAALGVIGEKPETLGMTLIYLGLAEGIAIYGVIVSLLILAKL